MTDVELRELFRVNGSREETIQGYRYRVSRDHQGRAVIGPKRHRMHGHLRRKPIIEANHVTYGAETNAEMVQGPQRGVAKVPTGVRAWMRRQGKAWRDRFYNEDWHKAVQHTGVDVVIWVGGGSFAAILVKGAWWVVSL